MKKYKNCIEIFGSIENAVQELYKLGARNFSYIDLRYTNFCDTNFFRANFHGSDFRYSVLRYTELRYTNFYGADFRYADFRYADCRYADFRNSDFCNTNFYNADFRYTDFRYSFFHSADFRDADFRDADFRDADFCGADIDFTSWPLSCKGLDVHVNDKQGIQLLFTAIENILYSKNTSKRIKKILSNHEIIDLCNEFHRDDVNRIEGYKEKNNEL